MLTARQLIRAGCCQIQELDNERQELQQAKDEAHAQTAKLSRARQKCEWQVQLLEELMGVLLTQRRDSIRSLKQLLDSARPGAAADGLRSEIRDHFRQQDAAFPAVHCQRSRAGRAEHATSDDEQQASDA